MGQRDQRLRKAAVEALGALRARRADGVDEQGPVDGVLARDGSEAHQVREQWHRTEVVVDQVLMADLAVAVAVGRVRELERDVGLVAG
jgi:hypothetical protein